MNLVEAAAYARNVEAIEAVRVAVLAAKKVAYEMKFNEDEPRDAHGRWGSGGGSTITKQDVAAWLADSKNKAITYHVTDTAGAQNLLKNGVGPKMRMGALGPGFYTSSKSGSESLSHGTSHELQVAVKLERPLIGTSQQIQRYYDKMLAASQRDPHGSSEALRQAMLKDHDGFIVHNVSWADNADWVIAFKPEAVKFIDPATYQMKFSDDEERDNHGRWTAGGSEEPDFAEELRAAGGKINADGTVTLYHGTTPEAAEKIVADQKLRMPGDVRNDEYGVYGSSSYDHVAGSEESSYGSGAVVAFEAPIGHIHLDDAAAREGGWADFRIPTRNGVYSGGRNFRIVTGPEKRASLEVKADVSDEERDEHGRWTDGGAGSTTSTPAAVEWFEPHANEKRVANGWWLDNNAVNSGPRGGNIRVFNLRHESRPDSVFVFERASEARQFAREHPGGTEHKGDASGHTFHGNRYTGGIGGDAGAHGIPVVKITPGELSGDAMTQLEKAMGMARVFQDEEDHPENYEPNAGFGVRLKPGATSMRVGKDEQGRPIAYDVRIDGTSWHGIETVPGSERPLPYVFRVMSQAELDGAAKNGYFQSDQRMNLADEGTVTSSRGTGTFYMTEGDNRIVRIRIAPGDNWKVDSDEYIKTKDRIPFERADLISPTITWTRTQYGGEGTIKGVGDYEVKGDAEGHAFHGNRYTGGIGGGDRDTGKRYATIAPGDRIWSHGKDDEMGKPGSHVVAAVRPDPSKNPPGWIQVTLDDGAVFSASPESGVPIDRSAERPAWTEQSKLAPAYMFDEFVGLLPPGRGGNAEAIDWRNGLAHEDGVLLHLWERAFESVQTFRANSADPATQRLRGLVENAPRADGPIYRGTSMPLSRDEWEERVGRTVRVPTLTSASTDVDKAAAFGGSHTIFQIEGADAHIIGNAMDEAIVQPGRYEVEGVRTQHVAPSVSLTGFGNEAPYDATIVSLRAAGAVAMDDAYSGAARLDRKK